jgi:hypothetical protein
VSYPQELPVELLLDRSALIAFVDGSVHVAEPIHEVVQDGVGFGVPAVCVAEALVVIKNGKDRQNVRRLLQLDACRVLPTDDNWMELAYWRELTGSIDRATAAMASLQYRQPILTSEPEHYSGGEIALDLIPFEH